MDRATGFCGMDYTLADLESARRQAQDSDAWAKAAQSRVEDLKRQGGDTTDARVLLKHLQAARRNQIERSRRNTPRDRPVSLLAKLYRLPCCAAGLMSRSIASRAFSCAFASLV